MADRPRQRCGSRPGTGRTSRAQPWSLMNSSLRNRRATTTWRGSAGLMASCVRLRSPGRLAPVSAPAARVQGLRSSGLPVGLPGGVRRQTRPPSGPPVRHAVMVPTGSGSSMEISLTRQVWTPGRAMARKGRMGVRAPESRHRQSRRLGGAGLEAPFSPVTAPP